MIVIPSYECIEPQCPSTLWLAEKLEGMISRTGAVARVSERDHSFCYFGSHYRPRRPKRGEARSREHVQSKKDARNVGKGKAPQAYPIEQDCAGENTGETGASSMQC